MTQSEAYEILKQGHNVFLTGTAGSGKTFVLNKYINYLKRSKIKVGITASTGVAATHLNGMTINAWAGIGVRRELPYFDLVELLKRRYLHKRFKEIEVLVIDEISMLPSFSFDLADRILRAFKKNKRPFGGVQLVLCGDFFQLPPVSTDTEPASFVFASGLWDKLDLKVCYLNSSCRHSDSEFIELLQQIRTHNISQNTWNTLKKCFFHTFSSDTPPTKLFTHNDQADAVNIKALSEIKGRSQGYIMKSNGQEILVELLKKGCLSPELLVLKKGAVVMFVKNNFDEGYVNGTLGRVVAFSKNKKYPIIKTYSGKTIAAKPVDWIIEENGKIEARIKQIPLRLAWAITIHKSQGMSLDAVEIDLGKSFVEGMGYVALSRARSFGGIVLKSINGKALQVNPEILKLDKRFKELSKLTQKELHKGWEQEMLGISIS